MDRAIAYFVQSILAAKRLDECCELAQASIDLAIAASKPFGASFCLPILTSSTSIGTATQHILGVKLVPYSGWEGHTSALEAASNTVQLSMEIGQLEGDMKSESSFDLDKQIAWARDHSLRVLGDHLSICRPHAIPKWFYLFNDFESLYEAAWNTCHSNGRTIQGTGSYLVFRWGA